ncbi:MAG: hypothetical protein LBO03_04960, partial [Acidaminococcales bacterium]|nr:hypothetical protein [Acidaminococcales bacterium]
IEQANKKLNGALYLDEVRLSGFMQVAADNVRIADREGRTVFQAAEVSARISLFKLLFNQDAPSKAISSVTVARGGKIFLLMDEEQKWNIDQLFKPSDGKEIPFYAQTRLAKTQLYLKLPQGEWLFSLDGSIDAAANPDFFLDLSVRQGENKLKLSGRFDLDGNGGVRLRSASVDAAPYAPLLKEAIGLSDFAGQVRDIDVTWNKKGKEDVFNGQAKLVSVSGAQTAAGRNLAFVLDGGLRARDNKLEFHEFKAAVNGQEFAVSGALSFQGAEPEAQNLTVAAAKFNLAKIWPTDLWQGDLALSVSMEGPVGQKFDKLQAEGRAAFGEAKAGQIVLRDGEADFSYQDGRLRINSAKLSVLGGKAEFSAEYDRADDFVAGQAKIADADLAQVTGSADFSGKVNGQAVFYGQPSLSGLRAAALVSSDRIAARSLEIKNLNVCLEQIDGDTLLQYASGSVGRGYFNAYGTLAGKKTDIEFAAGDLPIGELAALAGEKGHGGLNIRGSLRGDWRNPSGEAWLEAGGGTLAKQPFAALAGHVTFADKTISINDLLLKMDYGLHFAQGSISLGAAAPRLDLKITSKDVRLEHIAAFALPKEKITGNMDSLVVVRGALGEPEISGEILIHEASFREYFVEKVSGRYFYANKAVRFQDFNVKFMQTSVFFDGSADLDGSIDFDFRGDNIRLENLPQYEGIKLNGGVALKGTLGGNVARPIFSGEIKADAVKVNGEELNNLQGTAFSAAGLDNSVMVNFTSGGGEYSLNAGVNFNERFAHCYMEIENGNIKSLLAAAGYNLDVDGSLDGYLEMNPGGRRTGVTLRAQVRGGRIKSVPFETVDIDLNMSR